MKSILFAVLFLLIPKLCISQVSKTNELILSPTDKFVYLDSTNLETKSKDYVYIRVVKDSKLKQESYAVQEYYRSGVLRMEGTSKTSNGYSYDGKVNYFYENGNKKEEGEYIGNKGDAGKSYRLNQYWDENSTHLIIDGNGNYSCKNKTGYIETGKYKNGFKDGIFEGKNLKDNTSFIEKYENGKFISGTRTFIDNTKSEYFELETKPVPKKGMDDFYKFIAKNYRAPNQQGLKGKVYITFVVDKDGKIVEPKVLRDLGYGTGAEAIRVVLAYDGFSPGEQRGQKVRCTFSLPISIDTGNGNYQNQEPTYQSEMMKNTNPNWH
jgi:hypothetical protein